MPRDQTFDELLHLLRHGDEDAAREVFERFAGRLARLAHSRLDERLRAKLDADDVLQSVFRSFFARQRNGQFQLDGWDGLWSLLVRVTLRKCGRRTVAFHSEKRDVGREVSPNLSDDNSRGSWEAMAREPTPQEVVALTDCVAQLMRTLNDRENEILTLRLQGHTVEEIAHAVGRTQRTVYRILDKIQERAVEILEG